MGGLVRLVGITVMGMLRGHLNWLLLLLLLLLRPCNNREAHHYSALSGGITGFFLLFQALLAAKECSFQLLTSTAKRFTLVRCF